MLHWKKLVLTNKTLILTGLRWWVMRAWAESLKSPDANTRKTHRAVLKAAEIIDAQPQIKLVEVALRSNLSLSRLSYLFKAQIGMSLNDYRTQRRLLCVDALLAKSPKPALTTAAFEAGFGSYTQFYRCFIDQHACSPKDYYSILQNENKRD